MCKKTIHSEHADKGVFFEYLDFINVARTRLHSYKEKFQKYIEACKVQKKEEFDIFINENEGVVDKLFDDQKGKIEIKFTFLMGLLEEMKTIELEYLTKYKDFFKGLYAKVHDNFKGLLLEIETGKIIHSTFSRNNNQR